MTGLKTLLNIASLWLLLGGLAQAGTVHYYYTDPQGTPLVKADASGNIIARYDYAPYGTAVASLGAAPNGPGYTGHVNDPETGLIYMQARYYDPSVGRFISIDPIDPSTGNPFNFNRYGYANNNPVDNDDPDGRCAADAAKFICIEAHRTDAGGKSIQLPPAAEKFVKTNAVREQMAGGSKEVEPMKAVVLDSKGNEQLASMDNTKGSSDNSGKQVSGDKPTGTQAIIHGHTIGMGMAAKSGLGDAQPLTVGVPNVTVSPDGNREGVTELENGTVQFRMIRGSMTSPEEKQIQSNLNDAQQIINPDKSQ